MFLNNYSIELLNKYKQTESTRRAHGNRMKLNAK